jgi:hypothetical protein
MEQVLLCTKKQFFAKKEETFSLRVSREFVWSSISFVRVNELQRRKLQQSSGPGLPDFSWSKHSKLGKI